MQNGIIFSSSCGTRNSDVSATVIAGCRNQPRRLPDHFDVIDQHQQHEDAGEHAQRRDHEAAGKISPERVGHHAHAVTGRPNSRKRRAFDLLMASISAAGGSSTMPPMMIQRLAPIATRQHQILNDRSERRFHRHDGAGESRHAQPEHGEDGAADRKVAALTRGARRAEKRKGERGKCKRIDRRHETVMQFGAELSGQLHVNRIVGGRRRAIPRGSVRECPM